LLAQAVEEREMLKNARVNMQSIFVVLMKLGRLSYPASPLDSIWHRNFHVTIAYEDRAAGERAMQVFSKLVREFGDELHLHPHLWRFDVLLHPACRQFAENEGTRADLLIIATSSEEDLPLALREWFIASLSSRRTKGAVIALFGPEGHIEDENSSRFKFLRDASREAALEFFGRYTCDVPLGQNYAELATHGTETLLHPGMSNRGWGINE